MTADTFDEPAFVAAYRLDLARSRWHAWQDAAASARTVAALVDDPEHPATADDAAGQARAAAELEAPARALVAAAELDELELVHARAELVRDRLDQWRRSLAVHRDFRDHPDAYGGVDAAGEPIVDADERVVCASLEQSIADAELELEQLEAGEILAAPAPPAETPAPVVDELPAGPVLAVPTGAVAAGPDLARDLPSNLEADELEVADEPIRRVRRQVDPLEVAGPDLER